MKNGFIGHEVKFQGDFKEPREGESLAKRLSRMNRERRGIFGDTRGLERVTEKLVTSKCVKVGTLFVLSAQDRDGNTIQISTQDKGDLSGCFEEGKRYSLRIQEYSQN